MNTSLRYELTKYPTIYKKTYWGLGPHDGTITTNVINNRNEFINKYDIKGCILHERPPIINMFISNMLNSKYREYFDHIEVYKTNKSQYIIISSPYGDLDDLYQFDKIYPLYYNHATTFMKIIESHELESLLN